MGFDWFLGVEAIETWLGRGCLRASGDRAGSNPPVEPVSDVEAVANAVATTDPAGNRQTDKDKARFRIDGWPWRF